MSMIFYPNQNTKFWIQLALYPTWKAKYWRLKYYCIVTTMIHMQLYIYTCRNKINNYYERTHFFRKIYLSHFIRNGCERVMCEWCLGDWTNWNILTPSSFVFSSTSFSFCWAARSGVLRAYSPLLGAGSLYSILSPINWTEGQYVTISHTP